MGRKFSNQEMSGNVNIQSNGQHVQCNWFCINCHAVASLPKHYPNCTNKEIYAIPSTGEVPKKDASKKKWEIFKKQFVFAKPVGWWKYSQFSWWYKQNYGK